MNNETNEGDRFEQILSWSIMAPSFRRMSFICKKLKQYQRSTPNSDTYALTIYRKSSCNKLANSAYIRKTISPPLSYHGCKCVKLKKENKGTLAIAKFVLILKLFYFVSKKRRNKFKCIFELKDTLAHSLWSS